MAFDSTFAVGAVDLVASEPSPRGHVYTTLVRAPLGAG
jgi:2'-5' RNA ligase